MNPAITPWTPERQHQLIRLAAAGKSASIAAIELGTTRSAILGRAHRTGVKFNGTEDHLPKFRPSQRPRASKSQAPRPQWSPEAKAAQAERMRVLHATGAFQHTYGPRPSMHHPNRVKATAAHLAGVSAAKAARAFGCSEVSILKLWKFDPTIVALAQPIADQARADAKARVVERECAKAEMKRLAQEARARHNAPILARLPPRQALICGRVCAGETLQSVGESLGVTRERIRQIVAQVMQNYGLDTGGKHKGLPTKAQRRPPGYGRTVGAGFA